MAEQTKRTLMALVAEVTEGTPVAPSSGADYIAVRDGFTVEPNFEELANEEFNGTLGPSKSIQGSETPAASLDHYLRHSGVEGQEPDYGLLLEGLFGGKTINAVEYDTVAASTVSIVKVDAAEGANFQRGQALLVKDAVNGYSVRNVLSISTDDLNLGFNLANAPASLINLGKAIVYTPENADHPSFSLWDYRGNRAAVQVIAGTKVVEGSFESTATEMISGSFSMEGIKFHFDPIEIDATNDDLDFNDGGLEQNVSITQKLYVDPFDLASALEVAMEGATSDDITVSYDADAGKFTIASGGGTLELLWASGTNTATTIGGALGYSVLADDTGAVSYLGDSAISLVSPYTPTLDDSDPLVAKNNEVLLGDADDNACFCANTISMSFTNTKVDIPCVCAESGKTGSEMSAREVTIDISSVIEDHDSAEYFKRFRTNETTSFAYNFGIKSGGNWVAGKVCNLYIPKATITSFVLGDNDGLVSLEMSLKAFVQDGLGEVYFNFL